jgi:hypothetical protein
LEEEEPSCESIHPFHTTLPKDPAVNHSFIDYSAQKQASLELKFTPIDIPLRIKKPLVELKIDY